MTLVVLMLTPRGQVIHDVDAQRQEYETSMFPSKSPIANPARRTIGNHNGHNHSIPLMYMMLINRTTSDALLTSCGQTNIQTYQQ
jgi:hypothetical protein